MTEIFHQFDTQILQPGKHAAFSATPRWWGTLEFVRAIQCFYPEGAVFMTSFQVDNEEFVWPYPEKQFPIEMLGHKYLLAESPALRQIFPTKLIGPPNRVRVGFRSYAIHPIPIAVQWQWLEQPR